MPVPVGSPPCPINPSITRWNTVPGYKASDLVWPSRGSVHSRPPVARSTKFCTVLGACSGIRATVNEPWFVTMVALGMGQPPGGREAASLPGANGAPRRDPHGQLHGDGGAEERRIGRVHQAVTPFAALPKRSSKTSGHPFA